MPSKARGGQRRSSTRKSYDDYDDDDYEEESSRYGKGRKQKSKKASSSSSARRTSSGSRMQRRDDSFSDESSHYSDSSSHSHSHSSSASSTRSRDKSVDSSASASSDASSSRKSMSSESDVDTASNGSSEGSENSGTRFAARTAKTASLARPVSRQSQLDSKNTSRLSMAASLAMQRRKKESPQLKVALDNRRIREVDYHKGATELYTHIENQRWREVAERCRTSPIETKTWVYRMDKKKKNMLWRMLPIHTAILYRAPVYVLLDLIQAYPLGPNSPDDRRMLPIHMACRIVCKEDVLRLLLKHEPSSVFSEDVKGRTPRDFLAEAKKENKSKVLQKVNERNRKNLLKILKEFEQIRESSDNRSRTSRSRRRRDEGSSLASKVDQHSDYDNRPKRRPSSKHSISRGSGGSVRPPKNSRGKRRVDDDDVSRSSRRSRSSRVSKSSRSPRNNHDDDDDMSRMSRRSKTSRVSRSPRISGSRSSRRDDNDDDDDMSRMSRRSKTSRVSRSPRSPMQQANGSPKKSPRKSPRLPPSNTRRERVFVEEKPPKPQTPEEEYEEPNEEHAISTIKFDRHGKRDQDYDDNGRPLTAESAITTSTGVSENSLRDKNMEIKEDAAPDDDEYNYDDGGVDDEVHEALGELWMELEEKHPIPEEVIDEALIAENARRAQQKKDVKDDAISSLKYYDPPKELKKLLVVINSSDADASFDIKKKRPSTSSSNRAPLMPGRDNGASRRVNACGALKALSKNEKNRLRLGRTKGVVSSLCNALRDPSATVEERYRCSNTLMFLSVPKKNWEAIFNADENLVPTLTICLQDEDARVRYNACFCVFLLSKSEHNRHDIYLDSSLMGALVEVSDIEIVGDNSSMNDDQSIISINEDLQKKYYNLGSPSGIRQQGSPTSDEESKRGSRLSALKAFLSLSKLQEGSCKMVSNNVLTELLMRISGTMTVEENLLCLAIITNFTRDRGNIKELIGCPELVTALARGLASRNVEVQKCASMALQNLSCNKQFRLRFASYENSDILLSLLANVGSHVDLLSRIENINNGEGDDDNNEEKKKKKKKKPPQQSAQTAVEGQVSAIHAMKNLSIEPCNILPLTGIPGITASLITMAMLEGGQDGDGLEEKENVDENIRYVASDGLSNMSQWLNGIAVTCAQKNNVDLSGRPLNSMKLSTWNQWE